MSITFTSRGVFADRTLSDFCHQHSPPFDLNVPVLNVGVSDDSFSLLSLFISTFSVAMMM